MADLAYIECEGVRVPSTWSVDQLRLALATRHIRFENEEEIIWSFQAALRMRNSQVHATLSFPNEKPAPKRQYKKRRKYKKRKVKPTKKGSANRGHSQYFDKLRTDFPDFINFLNILRPQQRFVIDRRLTGQTLQEISKSLPRSGGEIGVTPERVRQIEARACRLLRWHCGHAAFRAELARPGRKVKHA